MKRKIAVAVSAMILAVQLGSPTAAQQASLEQLSTIAALLDTNDVGGLRAYVEANPALLEGDSPLAVLLRRFMSESSDVTTYLGFDADLNEMIEELARSGDGPRPPPRGTLIIDLPEEEGSDPGIY
jgi:hypothetical protein